MIQGFQHNDQNGNWPTRCATQRCGTTLVMSCLENTRILRDHLHLVLSVDDPQSPRRDATPMMSKTHWDVTGADPQSIEAWKLTIPLGKVMFKSHFAWFFLVFSMQKMLDFGGGNDSFEIHIPVDSWDPEKLPNHQGFLEWCITQSVMEGAKVMDGDGSYFRVDFSTWLFQARKMIEDVSGHPENPNVHHSTLSTVDDHCLVSLWFIESAWLWQHVQQIVGFPQIKRVCNQYIVQNSTAIPRNNDDMNYLCIYIYIYNCMNMCVYIYIYMFDLHIIIYIYIHRWLLIMSDWFYIIIIRKNHPWHVMAVLCVSSMTVPFKPQQHKLVVYASCGFILVVESQNGQWFSSNMCLRCIKQASNMFHLFEPESKWPEMRFSEHLIAKQFLTHRQCYAEILALMVLFECKPIQRNKSKLNKM